MRKKDKKRNGEGVWEVKQSLVMSKDGKQERESEEFKSNVNEEMEEILRKV